MAEKMIFKSFSQGFARQYLLVLMLVAIIGSTFIYVYNIQRFPRNSYVQNIKKPFTTSNNMESFDSTYSYIDDRNSQIYDRKILRPLYNFADQRVSAPSLQGYGLRKRATYNIPWLRLSSFASVVDLTSLSRSIKSIGEFIGSAPTIDANLEYLQHLGRVIGEWARKVPDSNGPLQNAIGALQTTILGYPIGFSSSFPSITKNRLRNLGNDHNAGALVGAIFPIQGTNLDTIDDTFLTSLLDIVTEADMKIITWIQDVNTAIENVYDAIEATSSGKGYQSTLRIIEENIINRVSDLKQLANFADQAAKGLKKTLLDFRSWATKSDQLKNGQNDEKPNLDDEMRVNDETIFMDEDEKDQYLGPKPPGASRSMIAPGSGTGLDVSFGEQGGVDPTTDSPIIQIDDGSEAVDSRSHSVSSPRKKHNRTPRFGIRGEDYYNNDNNENDEDDFFA